MLFVITVVSLWYGGIVHAAPLNSKEKVHYIFLGKSLDSRKGGRGAVKKHGASPDFFRGRYNEPFPKCVAVTVVSGQFYREFSFSHRKYLFFLENGNCYYAE